MTHILRYDRSNIRQLISKMAENEQNQIPIEENSRMLEQEPEIMDNGIADFMHKYGNSLSISGFRNVSSRL